MVNVRVCSDHGCPESNVKKDYTTSCGKCNSLIHLPCIGIFMPLSELLISEHIMVICGPCVTENSVDTASSAKSASTKGTRTPRTPRAPALESQRSILEFTRAVPGDKSTEMLSLLNEIKSSIEEHRKETKSYAEVLADSGASRMRNCVNKPLFSSVVAATDDGSVFSPSGNATKRKRQSVSRFTPKRSRTDQGVVERKGELKSRGLASGTNVASNHQLGGPVAFPKPRHAKSVYISRLKPDVSVESISDYVKLNVPEVNDDMFSLRLLVKKDKKLDELSFVSFRLSCSEELFHKLIDPAFWPSHVLIGEFIERRKRTSQLSDFLPERQTPAPARVVISPNPKTSPTPTPMEQSSQPAVVSPAVPTS